MRRPLLVTIDVEGGSEPDIYESVDVLDRVLDEIAIPVTLFITPDVISNRTETVAAWLDTHHHIGLHIHPVRLSGDSDWLASYDRSKIRSFLRVGRETFEDELGVRPTGFRAGRWSFSPAINEACAETGFEWDASYRPDALRQSYSHGGITEYPMSVYGNWAIRRLLWSYGINGLPLHADSFSRSRSRSLLLYTTTILLLLADSEYLMVSLHDYDLVNTRRRKRIMKYLKHLVSRLLPATIEELHRNTYSASR
jgi:peptidoglycan/xylan/chitin deacetylase (PgdA/CDA1 family)